MENDPQYQRQFRSDFRVRRWYVLTWLRYLKVNHPDYRHITISLDRTNALPTDSDISSSIITIIEEVPQIPDQPASGEPAGQD
jgi:hypothetical protein